MSERALLQIGTRVAILIPLDYGVAQQVIIYDYLPSRPWPYRIRPDGWEQDEPGIAFSANEIQPLTTKGITNAEEHTRVSSDYCGYAAARPVPQYSTDSAS